MAFPGRSTASKFDLWLGKVFKVAEADDVYDRVC